MYDRFQANRFDHTRPNASTPYIPNMDMEPAYEPDFDAKVNRLLSWGLALVVGLVFADVVVHGITNVQAGYPFF